MRITIRILLAVALFAPFGPSSMAQKKKSIPYADLPIVQPKQKKKQEMRSETLPPLREPPAAVTAATSRLTFEALPLTAKGLLSAQVRDTLRMLLHNSNGSTVVKLRAFVAGSGDMRRVQEIAAELFGERHQPLPALAVVQVGALPLEGAQVSIEATLEARHEMNPNGLAFVPAQSGASLADALNRVTAVLAQAHVSPADVLRATCFVSMLDASRSAPSLGSTHVVVVQMQREAVRPNAACEAVARLQNVRNDPAPADAALVTAPRLVLSGLQLGFGKQDADIQLALDRIDKALASQNSGWKQVVFTHAYLTSRALTDPLEAALRQRIGSTRPVTVLPFEGLSSIDALMGLDVVAVPQ